MNGEIFIYRSPLGAIHYELCDGVCSQLWLGTGPAATTSGDTLVSRWLDSYCSGTTLPLPPLAAPRTPFQRRMRAALADISIGQTITYGELAKRLCTSPRALGQALGANPLPLLIPCHRVIAANGLGGFSGGEGWKEKLLEFEGAI